jgi:8-oxo-dGTP pyrophosphatase MutT (NUDIX family)
VNQGESFEQALHREVGEELSARVRLEWLLGTAHFYRGAPTPENELLGVIYCCSLMEPDQIRLSAEHDAYRWVTPDEARELLSATDSSTEWIRRVIERAEAVRRLVPPALIERNQQAGFEMG